MQRNNRLKTILALTVIILGLAVIRIGPWPSLFEQGVAWITGMTGKTVESTLLPYGDKEMLKKQAAADRERAMELQRENAHLREEMRRLGFLRKMRAAPRGVVARVVGRDPAAWYDRVIVDGGRGAGMRAGWIAVTNAGLAGRATRCTATTCRVRLIVDPAAATSCVIHPRGGPDAVAEEADFFCMAYGAGARGLDILVVSSTRAASPGDLVVTSGYGGQYPRGLPLGVVRGPSRQGPYKGRGFSVRPHADFRNLEYLLLSEQ